MSHLSDALIEYAQLGVIDRATVRRLSDAAARDLGELSNLAGTVELCCPPVEGEASLCDRVRAAGEAAWRESERRGPIVTLRNRLGRLHACGSCPLSVYSEQNRETWCAATDRTGADAVVDALAAAPSWCPLRTGPVTVEGAP